MHRFRGRFSRRRNYDSEGRDRFYSSGNDEQGKPRHSRRPPPELKGREIGMWFARRSQENKRKMENNLPKVSMNSTQVSLVDDALSTLVSNTQTSPSNSRQVQTEPSNDWGSVVEKLVGRKFDSDKDVNNVDSFDDPEEFIRLSNQRRSNSNSFPKHLNKIKDSKFKEDYTANLFANQECDLRGLQEVKDHTVPSLQNKPSLNQIYFDELTEKKQCSRYQNMLQFREKLPSFKRKNEILKEIKENQVVVISGETGCGKTTQIAQFILDDSIEQMEASTCHVVCTQPRRISAISVAQRVAEERAEKLGNSVGYQIRLESVLPRTSGSIVYCTTGIVLQWLQSNTALNRISHLILDEIHERDVHSDFLLCITKDIRALRPDLKIILMSATLNAEEFSEYFGNCPVLHIPGFTFPVKEYYLEDVFEITGFKIPPSRFNSYRERKKKNYDYSEFITPYIRELETEGTYSYSTLRELQKAECEESDMGLVLELLRFIHSQPPGAILVFLSGWSEISNLHKLMSNDTVLCRSDILTIPLHSLMPTCQQKEVFSRPEKGVRKIVLATNIAETSITIDDIVYVVDCGKIKLQNYDKESNVTTLLPEWVALANARQRRGRAGRVQEGICYHLFSKARKATFAEYQLPELLRIRLEEIILQVKILKLGSCKKFLLKVMQPPDESIIDKSLQMLQTINALDTAENLTPLGFHLAKLPMDPFTGKMLLMGAIFSCLNPILTVAASLSFKDPFIIPLGKEKIVDALRKKMDNGRRSDHLLSVKVYNEWEEALRSGYERDYLRDNFLSSSVFQQLKRMRQQFMDLLRESNFIEVSNTNAKEVNRNSNNEKVVKAVITAGLYPNVARILFNEYGKMRLIKLKDFRKVYLHPKSVNNEVRYFNSHWMVYWEKMKSSQVFLHDTTVVQNYPLLFFGQKLHYGTDHIIVDDFVQIRCDRQVADVIKKLRSELDNLLEYKISHPGVTQWNRCTKEGLLLSTIVDLISSESVQYSTSLKGHHEF